MDQKIAGSVPSQGAYIGFRFAPQPGCVERQSIDVPLSLRSVNISLGDDLKKKKEILPSLGSF